MLSSSHVLTAVAACLLLATAQCASAADDWSLSASAGIQQLNVSWLSGEDSYEDDDSVFSPGITLHKTLSEDDSISIGIGVSYNFGKASWETGELDVAEFANEIYVIDYSSFKVNAHRLAVTLDVAKKVSDRWSVGVRGGPTVTFFDGTFDGTREAFQHRVPGELGVFIGGGQSYESGTKAAFGVAGEAFVRVDLVKNKVFAEVSAGYQWTDTVRFGPSSAAETSATGFSAAVSIGIRF